MDRTLCRGSLGEYNAYYRHSKLIKLKHQTFQLYRVGNEPYLKGCVAKNSDYTSWSSVEFNELSLRVALIPKSSKEIHFVLFICDSPAERSAWINCIHDITSKRVQHSSDVIMEAVILCSATSTDPTLMNFKSWRRTRVKISQDGDIEFYPVTLAACILLNAESRIIFEDKCPGKVGTKNDELVEVHPLVITCDRFNDVPLFPFEKTTRSLLSLKRNHLLPRTTVTVGLFSKQLQVTTAQLVQDYLSWTTSVEQSMKILHLKSTKVLTKGWMWKRSHYKVWHRRYFVLLSSNELAYYDSDCDGTAKGVIDLKVLDDDSISLRKDVEGSPGIQTIEIKCSKRTWFVCPEEEEGRLSVDEWMLSLSRCVRMQISISESSCNESSDHFYSDAESPRRAALRRGFFSGIGSSRKSKLQSFRDVESPRNRRMSFDEACILGSANESSFTKMRSSSDLGLFALDSHLLKRSNWQKVSGNVPASCLSLSPYSAIVLAQNIEGIALTTSDKKLQLL